MRKKLKNIARVGIVIGWIVLLMVIMISGVKDTIWIYPFVMWCVYTFFLTWNVTSKLFTLIQIGLSTIYTLCQWVCVNNGFLDNIYICFVYMMFLGLIYAFFLLRLIVFAITYFEEETE